MLASPPLSQLPELPPLSYSESLIVESAETLTSLLVKLSAAEHASTAIADLTLRLSTLESRATSQELLLHTLRREVSEKKRKAEELGEGRARAALIAASKGKHGLCLRQRERSHSLAQASTTLRAEEAAFATLQANISALSAQLGSQRAHFAAYEECTKQLQELYDAMFDGPTSDFPEEDEAEDLVFVLERQIEELQKKVAHRQKAVDFLSEAANHASYAVRALETARLSRHQSTVMPKPSCSLHRTSARRAMMHTDSVSRLYKLAVDADSDLSFSLHLPPLEDIFDSTAPSTSYEPATIWPSARDASYGRITAASAVMQQAARALGHKHAEARTRLNGTEKKLYKVQAKLRGAKQDLSTTRRTICIDILRSRGALCTDLTGTPVCIPSPGSETITDESYFSYTPGVCDAAAVAAADAVYGDSLLPAYSPVAV